MYGHKYTEGYVSVMNLKTHSTLEDLPPFHQSHQSTLGELIAYVMNLSFLEGSYCLWSSLNGDSGVCVLCKIQEGRDSGLQLVGQSVVDVVAIVIVKEGLR
ncbi:hypothetical protein CsSME_00005422 [Camellia sinensis var. sinensis]